MTGNEAIDSAKAKIVGKHLRIVLPEGEDPRIIADSEALAAQRLAESILISGKMELPSRTAIDAVLAQRARMTPAMAQRLLSKPLFRAGAMVAAGEAHAMLAGAAHPTARVIEAAAMTIGLASGIAT